MGHTCGVGFFAFSLCFVAFLSVNAAAVGEEEQAPQITKEKAKEALENAKNSTKEACEKAERYIPSAKAVLQRVQPFKKKCKDVQSQATQTAEGYNDAKALVKQIENLSNTVITLHENVTKDLALVDASLNELLTEAGKLKTECKAEELEITGDTANFTEIYNKASIIKIAADKLDENITSTFTIVDRVESTEKTIVQSLKEAQLANSKVSIIVAVADIESMIKGADLNLKETTDKKDEVKHIVDVMKKNCTTATVESNKLIKALCESANEALTSARSAVEKAKKAKEDINEQKKLADTALKTIDTANEVKRAQDEVDKATTCVDETKKIVSQLQSELETAKDSLTNVKLLEQQLKTALSTTTSAPTPEEVKEAEKSDLSLGEGTGTDQKDTRTQPTSKELPDQSNNSTGKLKDALSTGAQNVSTTALTGGKAPVPGANNDSAMTVSVPLLVALIASAALQ